MGNNIHILAPAEFPALLKEIPDAPHSLYIRGSIPPEDYKLLAVVGSRQMSSYGKDVCEHLIRGLRGLPVSIVSGLALGIDGVAHRAALSANLHTIAVPGSGLDNSVLYPRSHRALAQDILEAGGALLSEEEPLFRARPESFPKRNRIMAGMSHAVLVIEATRRSGTLITARLALDYNRELLCVPHGIFAEGGDGGHIFMKLGASPVRGAEDILEAIGIDTEKNTARYTLTEPEQKVIGALSEPLTRDELIRALHMHTAEANVLILEMELKGLVKETLGKVHKTV